MVTNIAGSSTSGASFDESLPVIYRDFRILFDETGVARSCATMAPLGAHEGATKFINNYGRLQAYAVGDGMDIAQAQAMSDAATGYTVGEIAVQTIISGRTMTRIADPDIQSRTSQILSNALDLKCDSDGLVQLQSFTATTLGSAGTVISPGHIAGGAARVKIGNNRTNPEPPPGDIYAIIHPLSAHVLAGRLIPYATTPAGATAVGVNTGAHLMVGNTVGTDSNQEMIRRGYAAIGTIGDAIVKTDANLVVDSGDDTIGAVFAKYGLIYVSELEPQLVPDTSDKSMRGAVEMNAWMSYAWGNYRASAFGNPAQFDASLPTS